MKYLVAGQVEMTGMLENIITVLGDLQILIKKSIDMRNEDQTTPLSHHKTREMYTVTEERTSTEMEDRSTLKSLAASGGREEQGSVLEVVFDKCCTTTTYWKCVEQKERTPTS